MAENKFDDLCESFSELSEYIKIPHVSVYRQFSVESKIKISEKNDFSIIAGVVSSVFNAPVSGFANAILRIGNTKLHLYSRSDKVVSAELEVENILTNFSVSSKFVTNLGRGEYHSNIDGIYRDENICLKTSIDPNKDLYFSSVFKLSNNLHWGTKSHVKKDKGQWNLKPTLLALRWKSLNENANILLLGDNRMLFSLLKADVTKDFYVSNFLGIAPRGRTQTIDCILSLTHKVSDDFSHSLIAGTEKSHLAGFGLFYQAKMKFKDLSILCNIGAIGEASGKQISYSGSINWKI